MDSRTISTETDPTFLSRFFLNLDEVYSEKRYLTVVMRTSIFERIFRKYLFPKSNGYLSLYDYINTLTSNRRDLAKFIERMKLIQSFFPEEGPLYIFNQLTKELMHLLEQDDFSLVSFDKYILKLEFFLAWHFENNFFEKQIDQKMNFNFFDQMYLQKGRTNFNYSVESLTTIFKFMKIFEKQSLTIRIPNDFENVNDLFCIEKIYYFYTDKACKHKNETGNMVEYLLNQLHRKLDLQNNAKVINYQLENYIMINLYLINIIIQNYSFYFTKKPELSNIFNSLSSLKSYPNPIGTFCHELTETILNEITFQGINIINKLREAYFVDYLSDSVLKVNTKTFRSAILVYSNEWDKRHYATINTENPSGFNIAKFVDRLKNKNHKKKNSVFDLREFTVRIFISMLFNNSGRVEFDDMTLRNIYNTFYPEVIENYMENKKKENDENEEEQDEEEEVNENRKKTMASLKMLLKVLDCGFDKTLKDFDRQIMLIANKIAKMKKVEIAKKKKNENAEGEGEGEGEEDEDNNDEYFNSMYTNEYLLPVTSMRNYLKPQYTEIGKVFGTQSGIEKSGLDIFELYKKSFVSAVMNYFPDLLPEKYDFFNEDEEEQKEENDEDGKKPKEEKKEDKQNEEEQKKEEEHKDEKPKIDLKEQRLQQLRQEIYANFKLNIVLIEEQETFTHFLKNLISNIEDSQTLISEKEFNHFWKYFVPNRSSIYPKFLLYIVPHYENSQDNPFKFFSSKSDIPDTKYLLSEFIASHDNIYKNIIFMPWASKSDPAFFSYIPVCRATDENIMQFPSIDTMFSFLKKPLDYYLTDSNGIFNLDLYSLTISSNLSTSKPIKSMFWKNANFTIEEPSKTKITMKCVDYLGLEQPENKCITLSITSPLQIKIYNLFYKEDVPFNYNNTSNNGYLEVFICDKYAKDEIEKICNYYEFIKNTVDVKYYEEFNVPQMDIKTVFKNYKVKSLVIETDKLTAKVNVDENEVIDYSKLGRVGTIEKKKTVPIFKFEFDDFKLNEEKYTIPIASFVSI